MTYTRNKMRSQPQPGETVPLLRQQARMLEVEQGKSGGGNDREVESSCDSFFH